MRTEVVQAQSIGGGFKAIHMPLVGEEVRFMTDVDHGDWKTRSVFPDRWPTIKRGAKAEMMGWFQNYYGTFVTVKYGNEKYDVEYNLIDWGF